MAAAGRGRCVRRLPPVPLRASIQRTDGGDLLALCQQNLVYRCDLLDGIRQDLLVPFPYFGVPDEVDCANISMPGSSRAERTPDFSRKLGEMGRAGKPGFIRLEEQGRARGSAAIHALADPTRRAVLERLSRGPVAMSVLAQPFKMALPSFSQHLDVLEDCGLVRSRKRGRVRTYQLAPQPLEVAERWMATQRAVWERRLDQLDRYLEDLKEQTR